MEGLDFCRVLVNADAGAFDLRSVEQLPCGRRGAFEGDRARLPVERHFDGHIVVLRERRVAVLAWVLAAYVKVEIHRFSLNSNVRFIVRLAALCRHMLLIIVGLLDKRGHQTGVGNTVHRVKNTRFVLRIHVCHVLIALKDVFVCRLRFLCAFLHIWSQLTVARRQIRNKPLLDFGVQMANRPIGGHDERGRYRRICMRDPIDVQKGLKVFPACRRDIASIREQKPSAQFSESGAEKREYRYTPRMTKPPPRRT